MSNLTRVDIGCCSRARSCRASVGRDTPASIGLAVVEVFGRVPNADIGSGVPGVREPISRVPIRMRRFWWLNCDMPGLDAVIGEKANCPL